MLLKNMAPFLFGADYISPGPTQMTIYRKTNQYHCIWSVNLLVVALQPLLDVRVTSIAQTLY